MDYNGTSKTGGTWAGCPPSLKCKLLALCRGEAGGSAKDAIRGLSKALACVGEHDAAANLERISWVDCLFGNVLVDFDVNSTMWKDNSDAAEELLSLAESRLGASGDKWRTAFGTHKTGVHESDPVSLSQRLNVYLCISAAFHNKDDEFRQRLSRALEDVESNVKFLLGSPDAAELAKLEDTADYETYIPGQRYWTEPLAILWNVASHIDIARFVRKAYARYIEFLGKYGPGGRGVRGRLLLDAEHAFADLADHAIAEIEPEFPPCPDTWAAVRELIAANPDLPVLVYAGPEGGTATYAEAVSASVVAIDEGDAPRTVPARHLTEEEEAERLVAHSVRKVMGGSSPDGPVDAARAGIPSEAIVVTALWKVF